MYLFKPLKLQQKIFRRALLTYKDIQNTKQHKNVDAKKHDAELHIFKRINHFSMGTLDYHKQEETEYRETRYVAMFPHQYKLNDNKGNTYDMYAKCEKVIIGSTKKK